MLSRVADSLYWMSRYLERAENTVRQLDVAMSLMLDSGGASAESHWQRLLAALGNPSGLEWNGDAASNAQKLVFDKHLPASVTCCIDAARENARQIREEISTEQWQRLNRLYHHMHSPDTESQFTSNINDVLATVIDAIHLFKGVSDTTMIHGQGWHFI
ncbi:MAG TPA: alpha-E domain-containing protein, partial [Nitrospira sp.]|nr:alpha-E domain-containing protein [Nitrospira sp.]